MSSGGDHSHSFTDLMTSLAVIFILLLVASLNNAFSESDDAKDDLRKQVADELRKLNLTITEDPNDPYTQIINLDEDKVKFEFNKAELKPEGKELIGRLFRVLTPKLCESSLSGKIESVIIEGHTDSSGNNTSRGKILNIGLSQGRAFAVFSEAVVALDHDAGEQVDCLRSLASAVGRGSSRPLHGAEDSKSRRVEVKIRVKARIGLDRLLSKEPR